MSTARELKEMLSKGQLEEAIIFCQEQLKKKPTMSYYKFWLNWLIEDKASLSSVVIDNEALSAETPTRTIKSAMSKFQEEILKHPYKRHNKLENIVNSSVDITRQKEELIKSLPYNGDIYLPTSKISLEAQVIGLKSVHELLTDENKKVTKLRFYELKYALSTTCKKRVFVIGNGPSLKFTDLSLLNNEVTIGFNGIFLHDNFTPTIFVVEDHLVAEDRVKEIIDYKCPVKIFPSYLSYCLPFQENTIFLNHLPRNSFPVDTDFSDDVGTISYTGGTVTYTGLQIAISLGFDEIYLIGVDASYKVENVKRSTDYGTGVLSSQSDDVNHFDSRYFGKGYRWHDPNINTMLQAYRKVRNYADMNNKKVCNATLGGKLEVFPRVNYYDLFDFNKVYPKIGIIDFTHIDWLCATGILKKNMFAGWAKHSLLHVYSQTPDTISAFQSVKNDCYADGADTNGIWAALRSLIEYNPDVLYLRPTPDRPLLIILQLIIPSIMNKPFVIHYMDDWLSKIKLTMGEEKAILYRKIMEHLFKKASRVFTISQKMSNYIEQEFSIPKSRLQVVHNYINNENKLISPKNKKVKIIRYFGGLQSDMSLASIIEVAEVVESMNKKGQIVHFEIFTSVEHIKKYGANLKNFEHSQLFEQHQDYHIYLALLKSSDINMLCYNFDDASRTYLRFSMANKLPELIGSETPFIAIGSSDIGTISYLLETGYPFIVSEINRHELSRMIHQIITPTVSILENYNESRKNMEVEFSPQQNKHLFQATIRKISSMNYVGDDLTTNNLLDLYELVINSFSVELEKNKPEILFLSYMINTSKSNRANILNLVRSHGIKWQFKKHSEEINSLDIQSVVSPIELAYQLVSLGHERFEIESRAIISHLSKTVSNKGGNDRQ